MTLPQAERAALDDDSNVLKLLTALENIGDAQCRDAADELRNAVQLQRGSSETLCNLRAAQGIGSNGEKLTENAGPLLAGVDARLARFEEPGSKGCAELAGTLKVEVAKFLERRGELCDATRVERALLDCRGDARVKSFCEARSSDREPTPDASEKVRECLR